ncbi:hypothetical protein C8D88_11668 [Lentzea atacamensis]|uniref:Uncharacterized protein n=1 Tax=Lentzea atacamensis TaxID=531938 RepID=A0A316HNP3_9PSEU|nr:hypothetical protein [Lentzea atacamensis]PWK81657.1 hypothetical protein C8D88_11668 [Lentzea atacamensis]
MTRLAYSEDLYYLLLKAGRNVVLFHDDTETHVRGFSWVCSDMTEWAQESFVDFRHAGLIQVGHHEPWGAEVTLTDAGVARLAEWRLRLLDEDEFNETLRVEVVRTDGSARDPHL